MIYPDFTPSLKPNGNFELTWDITQTKWQRFGAGLIGYDNSIAYCEKHPNYTGSQPLVFIDPFNKIVNHSTSHVEFTLHWPHMSSDIDIESATAILDNPQADNNLQSGLLKSLPHLRFIAVAFDFVNNEVQKFDLIAFSETDLLNKINERLARKAARNQS